MITIIPVAYYESIFYNITLIFVLATFFHLSSRGRVGTYEDAKFCRSMGILLFWFVVLYMGLRPVNGYYFGDMKIYALQYEYYAQGGFIHLEKDPLFYLFMYLSSQLFPVEVFFFLCTVIYIVPMWIVAEKHFGNVSYYSFLLLIASFSFWGYGVNGIRQGLGTSLFLLGLAYNNDNKKYLFFCLAVLTHQSLLLPIGAYLATLINNNPLVYIRIWFASIPISLMASGVWVSLFSSLGLSEEKMVYFSADAEELYLKDSGFRLDFIFYSSASILVGWYFIFRKNFYDVFYYRIFNLYALVNSVWILVIKANFSNRFAYLSWFFMSLVCLYPILKQKDIISINSTLAFFVIGYFSFTYIMLFIL